MDIRKLQRAIVDGLEDVKAHDIVVFNTEHLSPLFERVIIASGTSNRQTKALASSVRDAVKSQGLPILSTEGGENGEWIIVDCGPAVAHIMQPAIRDYYRLEEIWGGKPVKVKLADGAKGLVKASSADDDDDDVPVAKKPAAKKGGAKAAAPAKTSASKSPAAKKAGVRHASVLEAQRAVSKQPPGAKKPPAAKKAAAKVSTVKVGVPKKSAAKTANKAPAKAAPAPRAAAKKSAPRKSTSKA